MMKHRALALLPGLLVPVLALAELSSLSVQITPEKTLYTQGDTLRVSASGNGSGMEYRLVLSRPDAGATPVLETPWGTGNTFDIVTGSVITPSADYRLKVVAREAANPAHRLADVTSLSVRSAAEMPQAEMALLQYRYDAAAQTLRDALKRVITRQGDGRDLTSLFYQFASNEALIAQLLNRNGALAPQGGPAFVPGVGLEETGAIGVDLTPPSSMEDWWGTAIILNMPAYRDLPPSTVVISYETVLSPEEAQAQRDLVLARYNLAVATTRDALLRVIRRQGKGWDVAEDFIKFSGAAELIHMLLNRTAAYAPRGGNAFNTPVPNDSTGAIGVELQVTPGAFDNWWGTTVVLRLPAFLGLAEQSTEIRYDTVLSASDQQAERDLLVARYAFASAKVRDMFRRVIQFQGEGRDTSRQYYLMSTAPDLINGPLREAGVLAPRGGPAFRDGVQEDMAGSIGIEMIAAPASPADWWGAAIAVHLPAYNGLTPQSVTITYDNVLSPTEEQAQRDLVVARYQRAISRVRETFAAVRSGSLTGASLAETFNAMQSGEALIDGLLNRWAVAPRGGPAFRVPVAYDQLGAVGIELTVVPASDSDWSGTRVTVSLPAFLGMTPESTVIGYDD